MSWRETTLGEITDLKRGFDLPKSQRLQGDVPVYSSSGITGSNSTAAVEGPCVITGRYGTIGEVFFSGGPCWPLNTALYSTEFNGNNPRFIYYLLQTIPWQGYTTASAVPGVNRNHVNLCPVKIPDRATQDAIVEVLDSIVDKIALNNRLNDYLEQLVDGKFQELFGGLNFNATLSDVAEITMGQSPAGSSYNEEGAGIIFYQGRGEFGWRFPKRRLYTTEPKRLACEGDVLMSVRAPVGDLNVAFENCCIGRGLAAIHSETPSFALYLMRFLKPQLEAYNGEGTVFGSINGKALKSLEVALPSHNEVMQFESFAAPIDALIRSNENETRKLNNLRNYLLPKLMSGEIDVSKVDLTQLTNNHLPVRGHNVPNCYWKEPLWKPSLIVFCRRCRTCLIRHSSNIWPKYSESRCCQLRKHQRRRIC